MSTKSIDTDLEAICASVAAKKAVDPEIARRVQEQAEKIRERLRRTHDKVNVAVDFIRRGREE